jgi:hypothetical protein
MPLTMRSSAAFSRLIGSFGSRYGVIYADPEWRFEVYSRETGMDRAADNHYPTSATEEIWYCPYLRPGVLKSDELAAARQWDWIVETTVPASISHSL